jgi:hypothetical protein
MKTKNKNQEERFEKVVKWDSITGEYNGGFFDFLVSWLIMIFCSLIFPIIYIVVSREVYWRKIK